MTTGDNPDETEYIARALSDERGWNLGIVSGGNTLRDATLNLLDELGLHE